MAEYICYHLVMDHQSSINWSFEGVSALCYMETLAGCHPQDGYWPEFFDVLRFGSTLPLGQRYSQLIE